LYDLLQGKRHLAKKWIRGIRIDYTGDKEGLLMIRAPLIRIPPE